MSEVQEKVAESHSSKSEPKAKKKNRKNVPIERCAYFSYL